MVHRVAPCQMTPSFSIRWYTEHTFQLVMVRFYTHDDLSIWTTRPATIALLQFWKHAVTATETFNHVITLDSLTSRSGFRSLKYRKPNSTSGVSAIPPFTYQRLLRVVSGVSYGESANCRQLTRFLRTLPDNAIVMPNAAKRRRQHATKPVRSTL